MHIKSRKKQAPYKRIIAIGLAVLLLGVVIFGIQHQKNAYATNVKAYKAQAKQIITTANQATIAANHDPQAIKIALQRADGRLQKLAPPKATKILGLSLRASEDRQQAEAVDSASKKLQLQLQVAVTMLGYQQQVMQILEPLKTTKADNTDSLKAASSQWTDAQNKLKAAKAPTATKEFHQSLTEKTGIIAAEINKLPQLFDQQDVGGFNSQRQAVSVALEALRASQNDLNKVLQAEDAKLGTATKKLLLAAQ